MLTNINNRNTVCVIESVISVTLFRFSCLNFLTITNNQVFIPPSSSCLFIKGQRIMQECCFFLYSALYSFSVQEFTEGLNMDASYTLTSFLKFVCWFDYEFGSSVSFEKLYFCHHSSFYAWFSKKD